MREVIIRTRRLVGELRRQCRDLHDLQNELDLLAHVALVLEDAARLLRRTLETRPEIARDIVQSPLQ